MTRIVDLLERVNRSEQARILPGGNTIYYKWMVAATTRILELEERLEALENAKHQN